MKQMMHGLGWILVDRIIAASEPIGVRQIDVSDSLNH